MEITRAFLWKVIGLGVLWPLVDDDILDFRNDVTRTLDDNGIADANVAALSQRLAISADALDVVFIVQGDILHDHSTHADGIEFANGRKRSGSADLKFDILEDGHCAFGRKFVGDSPARRTRNETKSLLPVDTVNLVDDAVDVVVELGPAFLDLAMKGDELLGRVAESGEWIRLEPARFEPFDQIGRA